MLLNNFLLIEVYYYYYYSVEKKILFLTKIKKNSSGKLIPIYLIMNMFNKVEIKELTQLRI